MIIQWNVWEKCIFLNHSTYAAFLLYHFYNLINCLNTQNLSTCSNLKKGFEYILKNCLSLIKSITSMSWSKLKQTNKKLGGLIYCPFSHFQTFWRNDLVIFWHINEFCFFWPQQLRGGSCSVRILFSFCFLVNRIYFKFLSCVKFSQMANDNQVLTILPFSPFCFLLLQNLFSFSLKLNYLHASSLKGCTCLRAGSFSLWDRRNVLF